MKSISCILVFLVTAIAFGQDIESLSWKEGRLNNRLNLTVSLKEYTKMYRTSDSITNAEPQDVCPAEAGAKILHHKGAKFLLVNDMLTFKSIDFTKNSHTYISFKNDWFDHSTTLKNFRKTYPLASEYMEDFITDDGDVYDMISLLPQGTPDNFEWLFYFNDGKLVIIECLFSCN